MMCPSAQKSLKLFRAAGASLNLGFMQVLQISICPEQIMVILLVLKKHTTPKKKKNNPFIRKADLTAGLVNVLHCFARLQCSIWGLKSQSQGPSVI